MIVFTSILTYLTSQGNNTNMAKLIIHYLSYPGSIKSVQELCASSDCINPDVILTNQLYFNSPSMFPEGLDEKKAIQTCLNRTCTTEAYGILKNMDKTVNPCSDFYNYACGSFVKNTDLGYEDYIDNYYDQMQKVVIHEIVDVLEENLEKSAPLRFKPARILYEGCTNDGAKSNLGKIPLMTLLGNLGGWPVLMNSWNEAAFSWEETIYRCRRLGCPIDSLVEVMSYVTEGKQYVLIGPPTFVLNIDDYKLKNNIESYRKIIFDVAYELEKTNNDTTRREISLSLNFEIELASFVQTNDVHFYLISDLEKSIPKFPWLKYLQTILAPNNKISRSDTILVKDVEYIRKLADLLEATPKRVLANYLLWRVVINGMKYLAEYYERLWVRLRRGRHNKLFDCYVETYDLVPLSIQFLYAKKYLKENNFKDKVMEIVNDIKDALRGVLREAHWVTAETRKNALDKLDSMQTYVAYPTELNTTAVDQYYSKVKMSPDQYFETAMKLTALKYDYLINKPWEINKNARCDYRVEEPFVTYYDCDNSLELPSALLRGMVFSVNRPAYLNYGFLGYMIGYQLVKSLTGKGNVLHLWDDEHVFDQISSCFQYRYSEMTQDQLGKRYKRNATMINNVVENVAIQLAHRAYNFWIERNGPEQILPGFEKYTSKQLFWLSFARSLCSKYSNDLLEMMLEESETPEQIRLNGCISNIKQFGEDYLCPLNSHMNPQEKCAAW